MANVVVKITSQAELEAAKNTLASLQAIVAQTGAADAKTKDYQATIAGLNSAIANNTIALTARAQALANDIKLADSVGVNAKALKAEYEGLAKQIAQMGGTQGGVSFFGKMKEELIAVGREVPGLGGIIEKTFQAATGAVGAFAVALGVAYESLKNYAGMEVVWAKLDAALAAHGHLLDGTRDKYEKLAEQMADQTLGTTDQQWAGIITRMVQFGRTTQQVMGDVSTIRNMAGVMGSLSAATNGYTEAMNGQFFLLRRHGIVIDQHLSQMQKMAELEKQAALIGGSQLTAYQNTLIGQWEFMTTQLDRLTRALGSDFMPALAPIKWAMRDIGNAAEFMTKAFERVVPMVEGLHNAVGLASESMGDSRQNMEDYQRAWKLSESEISNATKALQEHDAQLDATMSKMKEFADWQQNKDILDIQRRNDLTPGEKEAMIAERKGRTAEDIVAAQQRLDSRKVQEQKDQIVKLQAIETSQDKGFSAIMNNPNTPEPEKVNAQTYYIEARVALQKQMADAVDALQKAQDTQRLDAAEGVGTVGAARQSALGEAAKNTAEQSKQLFDSRFNPNLSPDTLATPEGQMFLLRSLNPAYHGEVERQVASAGGTELQSLADELKTTQYQYLRSRAIYYKASIDKMKANIDLHLASAQGDQAGADAARQAMAQVDADLNNGYSSELQTWIKNGRQGPMPVNPRGQFDASGNEIYTSDYMGRTVPAMLPLPTGALPPDVTSAISNYSNFQLPNAQMPLPQARPVDRSLIDAGFIDATNNPMIQKPPGFDPNTQVFAINQQGGVVYPRLPDGTADMSHPIFNSAFSSGQTPTAGPSVLASLPALPGSQTFLAGVPYSGQPAPASPTAQPDYNQGQQAEQTGFESTLSAILAAAVMTGILRAGLKVGRWGGSRAVNIIMPQNKFLSRWFSSGATPAGVKPVVAAGHSGDTGVDLEGFAKNTDSTESNWTPEGVSGEFPSGMTAGRFSDAESSVGVGAPALPSGRVNVNVASRGETHGASSASFGNRSSSQYENFKNNYDAETARQEVALTEAEREHVRLVNYDAQLRGAGRMPLDPQRIQAAAKRASGLRYNLATMKGNRDAILLDVYNNPSGAGDFGNDVPSVTYGPVPAGGASQKPFETKPFTTPKVNILTKPFNVNDIAQGVRGGFGKAAALLSESGLGLGGQVGRTLRGAARIGGQTLNIPVISDVVDVGSVIAGGLSAPNGGDVGGEGIWDRTRDALAGKILDDAQGRMNDNGGWFGRHFRDFGASQSLFSIFASGFTTFGGTSELSKDIQDTQDSQAGIEQKEQQLYFQRRRRIMALDTDPVYAGLSDDEKLLMAKSLAGEVLTADEKKKVSAIQTKVNFVRSGGEVYQSLDRQSKGLTPDGSYDLRTPSGWAAKESTDLSGYKGAFKSVADITEDDFNNLSEFWNAFHPTPAGKRYVAPTRTDVFGMINSMSQGDMFHGLRTFYTKNGIPTPPPGSDSTVTPDSGPTAALGSPTGTSSQPVIAAAKGLSNAGADFVTLVGATNSFVQTVKGQGQIISAIIGGVREHQDEIGKLWTQVKDIKRTA